MHVLDWLAPEGRDIFYHDMFSAVRVKLVSRHFCHCG